MAAPAPFLRTATREEVSQYAMLTSMTTGTFEDVKFYLFSRRDASSRLVHSPRPLYANRALLCKASPHLEFMFSAGFSESQVDDIDAPFPPQRAASTRDYDYGDDSDLDEDDSEDDTSYNLWDSPHLESRCDAKTPASLNLSTPWSRPGTPQSCSGAPPFRPGTSRFSCCSDGKPSPSRTGKLESLTPTGDSLSPPDEAKGRVVFVEDFAFRTWQAFIYYAYFGTISFAPLRSEKPTHQAPRRLYDPPLCSSKSMYRLADKYRINELKALAMDDLRRRLTTHNAFVELFSSFTLSYPAIQDCEIKYLRSHIGQAVLCRQIPRIMKALEEGRLLHGSRDVLAKLFIKMASNGDAC
ncbi:hypothetical protein C8Q77DRAFT_1058079 [Trametes polyzona]|nr:hypothetical protein C8Q77DRAFT_1058079 [Trametes polyzona]